jgi:Tfp pilus assembly protein PilE
VVVAIGVMAAIAIPRFSKAVREARAPEQQARVMLRDAWTKEQVYRAENGAYASTLEDLRGVGWEEPPDSAAFGLSVVTSGRDNLCIEAMSRTGTTRVLSIQNDGRVEPVGCSMGSTASNAAEEARIALQRGWQLLTAYRKEHGGLPRDLTEIAPKIERQGALANFRLGYSRGVNGEYCLSVRPRGLEGPERSVDDAGRFFLGSACAGHVLENFADEIPVPDSAGVR